MTMHQVPQRNHHPAGGGLYGVPFTVPAPPQPPRRLSKVAKGFIVAGVTVAAALPLLVSAIGINLAVSDYATANLSPHKFTSAAVSEMLPEFSPSIHTWGVKGVDEEGTVAYTNADQSCELYVSNLSGATSHLASTDIPYVGSHDKEATEQLISSLAGATQEEVSGLLTKETLTTPLGAPVDVLTIDATDEGVASLARLFVSSDQGFAATVACDTPEQAKQAWGDVVEESTVKLTHQNSFLNQM